jgi:hypothetical protein
MKGTHAQPSDPGAPASLEERLERCEVIHFPVSPFPLPQGDDLKFLLAQQLGKGSKNISYTPKSGKAAGFRWLSRPDAERLRDLLATFSKQVTAWLAEALPHYAVGWRLDQVSFRPEEEATRQLRQKARNDLLHVDAFPSRPTQGHRILRCFANVNPHEPRVWITSEPFARLLQRFGTQVGLPQSRLLGWPWRLPQQFLRIFRPDRPRRSPYDSFMLRFHDFLKANEEFQERCTKRCWTFGPGSAWLVFTDAVSHAALRGRFALEHSYFVPPEALVQPELSPLAVLQRACGGARLDAA